jgi:hypothetical protein
VQAKGGVTSRRRPQESKNPCVDTPPGAHSNDDRSATENTTWPIGLVAASPCLVSLCTSCRRAFGQKTQGDIPPGRMPRGNTRLTFGLPPNPGDCGLMRSEYDMFSQTAFSLIPHSLRCGLFGWLSTSNDRSIPVAGPRCHFWPRLQIRHQAQTWPKWHLGLPHSRGEPCQRYVPLPRLFPKAETSPVPYIPIFPQGAALFASRARPSARRRRPRTPPRLPSAWPPPTGACSPGRPAPS